LIEQLQRNSPDTKDLEKCQISFASDNGRRRNTYSLLVDVRANTAQFNAIQRTEFKLFHTPLETLDIGPSVPENLLRLDVNHVPGMWYASSARQLADLIHKAHSRFKVHNIFLHGYMYPISSSGTPIFKTINSLAASVEILGDPTEGDLPGNILHKHFPGFIRLYEQECKILYTGRGTHCCRCKSKAKEQHALRECPRGKKARDEGLCFWCLKGDHIGRYCEKNPRRQERQERGCPYPRRAAALPPSESRVEG